MGLSPFENLCCHYFFFFLFGFKNLADFFEKGRNKRLQRETQPLEPSLDHLWATLFHRLLRMGKGWLCR